MWVCSSKWKSERNTYFYDGLKCEWYVHSAGDLVMCFGDLSGHVGRHIDGVHGGCVVG